MTLKSSDRFSARCRDLRLSARLIVSSTVHCGGRRDVQQTDVKKTSCASRRTNDINAVEQSPPILEGITQSLSHLCCNYGIIILISESYWNFFFQDKKVMFGFLLPLIEIYWQWRELTDVLQFPWCQQQHKRSPFIQSFFFNDIF